MKGEMNKKICLLCICLCVILCACHGTVPGSELPSQTTGQSVTEMTFLKKYHDFSVKENAKRVALIYLDEDSIPELLILKGGEYRLYFFDGSEVRAVTMPDTEIKASAYGPRHDFEDSEHQTFYWFEYVPHKGLLRVHDGDAQERHDYYIRYSAGSLSTELETKSIDYTWYTYDSEKEITNEDFLNRLFDLGYDELIPCAYLYENVTSAYENIGIVSDSQKVLEAFVNGETQALDYVEAFSDIPEDGFVMRSYVDFYDDITAGEGDIWGSLEYTDFDNDGKDELIIHGYTGSRLFFDVIGNTVYKVLRTGSTTDIASVAVFQGERVIERADFLYVGRKNYEIMKYDSCCCLIDWFRLYAEYDGADYSENDKFEYRNKEISMEEFEKIRNSIEQP